MTDPWSVFGADPPSVGAQFEALRRRLVFYFESHRCDDPEELAHITLDRLMRKHGERVEVRDLVRYSYGVAQNVLYEYLRRKKAEKRYVGEQKYRAHVGADDGGAAAGKELRLRCLDECVAHLSPEDRALLADYFKGRGRGRQERRRVMAEQLNISREALTMRVFHLKRRLRKCVVKCVAEAEAVGAD